MPGERREVHFRSFSDPIDRRPATKGRLLLLRLDLFLLSRASGRADVIGC